MGRDRDRSSSRHRSRSRERRRSRDRDRRDRSKDKQRDRSKDRHRDSSGDRRRNRDRSRDRTRDHSADRQRSRKPASVERSPHRGRPQRDRNGDRQSSFRDFGGGGGLGSSSGGFGGGLGGGLGGGELRVVPMFTLGIVVRLLVQNKKKIMLYFGCQKQYSFLLSRILRYLLNDSLYCSRYPPNTMQQPVFKNTCKKLHLTFDQGHDTYLTL